MKKTAALVCTCVILIGCTSTPKVDTIAEAKAIRNLENQWMAAIKAKDTDKIAGFYSSNAVTMFADLPIFVGKEAILKSWEMWFSDTTIITENYFAPIDTVEVSASGDLAYVRGKERFIQNTPDGPIEVANKWVDIWKKTDGEWKCIVTIGNSDKP